MFNDITEDENKLNNLYQTCNYVSRVYLLVHFLHNITNCAYGFVNSVAVQKAHRKRVPANTKTIIKNKKENDKTLKQTKAWLILLINKLQPSIEHNYTSKYKIRQKTNYLTPFFY